MINIFHSFSDFFWEGYSALNIYMILLDHQEGWC